MDKSREPQVPAANKRPRPQLQQEFFPTLTSRNPFSTKQHASNGHIGRSAASPEPMTKKIKLEPDSTRNSGRKTSKFIDLTLDSSDDETRRRPGVTKPTKKAVPRANVASELTSGRVTKTNTSRDEDRMAGVTSTRAPVSQAKGSPEPIMLGRSSTDGDFKAVIEDIPGAPVKRITTTGPFNCDDSDDESETELVVQRSKTILGRSSPTPNRGTAPDMKVLEEKAAQRRYAAELREKAAAKKKAAALVEKGTTEAPTTLKHNAQRPTLSTASRKVEPGRFPTSNTTTSSSSTRSHPEQKTWADPSLLSGNEHISPLQKATNAKAHQPVATMSTLINPISPPPMRKVSKKMNLDPPQEATFAQQPSRAANAARSHISELGNGTSSQSSFSTRHDQDGLSQAQKAELSGEDPVTLEEQVAAPPVKEKQVIDLAAAEDPIARSNKKAELQKAILVEKARQAQLDALRAAERRRRIDENKAKKESEAQKAAIEERRRKDEHSRIQTKKRLDREAEEARAAEERKASAAKLKRVNEEELQRKKLEARKAQIELTEQQEQAKQDRIKKQHERNARMHAAAIKEAEAEPASPQHEDLGELILEGEPTDGHDPQVSKHDTSAQIGETSATPTGPFSLNSARATNEVLKKIASASVVEPKSVTQRVAQEKQVWKNDMDKSANDNAVRTPVRKSQDTASPFFTNTPGRTGRVGQGGSSSSIRSVTSLAKSRDKRLLPLAPEDAKLIQWRDQEDLSFDKIATAYYLLTSKKLSEGTLRKRYTHVRQAVNEAKVPFSLMKLLADGDKNAEHQVNSILEAAFPELAIAKGQVKPLPVGGGPIKLPPLSQHTGDDSPLSQVTSFGLRSPKYDDDIVKPRSTLPTLTTPQERPTTGGKCPIAVWELALRADLERGVEESDEEAVFEPSHDDDLFNSFEPEDYEDYGFQVQRREMSTEEAEEGFPIDNQEWIPCGDVYRNKEEANIAAVIEITTILPGCPYYADPKNSTLLRVEVDGLQFCHVVHPVHGECQTRVAKVLQAPLARDQPPTRKDIREKRAGRKLWYIVHTFAITPPYDVLFDETPEPRIEVVDNRVAFSDPDLVNKRAAQDFVDHTHKSDSRSLPTRAEEKRARVEGYLAGILADTMFEAEMELVSGMETYIAISKEYGVEKGSTIVLTTRIAAGVLAGPMN